MSVIVRLDTGDSHRLDRDLRVDQVAEEVNYGRGKDKLVAFQNDAIPSRKVYLDPDHVVSIRDDGF